MSEVNNEEAVITIKVKLESDVEGLEDVEESTKQEKTELDEKTIDNLAKDLLEAEKETGPDAEKLKDLVNDVDSKGIKNLNNFAKSPSKMVGSELLKVIGRAGPYGALAAAIITMVLASPELYKTIIQVLGVKGGPLNQDFRYSLDEQENQQFDRVVQFRRLMGDDPVITVTTKGYVVGDPDFVGNSLINADLARTARIALQENSLGPIDGI